jgi:hypothetical protein
VLNGHLVASYIEVLISLRFLGLSPAQQRLHLLVSHRRYNWVLIAAITSQQYPTEIRGPCQHARLIQNSGSGNECE